VKPIWPFGHIGLKLLSLAMAVSLWMVVAGEETVERGLRIPLELQQLPAGLELTGEIPSTVDVRVRGQSGALSRVSPGDVVAVLDLHGARSGHRLFPLTPDQVRVPFGVTVVQIAPAAIAMAFEPSASRQVPVVPAVDGRPAPGYVVGDKTAEPRTVEVIGPEGAVSRATEVVTEPVPVTGAHDTVRESVILGVLDPTLRLNSGRTATVTVQIVPAPVERSLRGRPVHLRNIAPGLEAEAVPNSVEVGLRGSRDGLNRMQPDDISAYVDLEGLGPGEYALTVHADVALDAGVTHIQPPSVQVRVTSGKH
jgi:YbbR domain-containing protein